MRITVVRDPFFCRGGVILREGARIFIHSAGHSNVECIH